VVEGKKVVHLSENGVQGEKKHTEERKEINFFWKRKKKKKKGERGGKQLVGTLTSGRTGKEKGVTSSKGGG